MNEIQVPPSNEQLPVVVEFVRGYLKSHNVKMLSHASVIAEEIFTNIINYAQLNNEDLVRIVCDYQHETKNLCMRFIDKGFPYNPLEKINLNIMKGSTQERKIGGLGILMVQKLSDDIFYEYRGNENIMTIVKKVI